MLTYQPSTRAMKLDAGPFSAQGGVIAITTNRTNDSLCDAQSIENTADGFAAQFALLRLEAEIRQDNILTLTVTNTGDKPIRLEQVALKFPAETFAQPRDAMQHHHLIHSPHFCQLSGVKPVGLPTNLIEIDAESSLVSVYTEDENGQAILIGALPPFGSSYTRITTLHDQLHMQGNFGFEVSFEFRQQIEPGKTVATAPVAFIHAGSGNDVLDLYKQLLAGALERPRKPLAYGWNSWDYYLGSIQRSDMDENTVQCRQNFGDLVKYMVIDEGYECIWGIWEPNWKFSEGLTDYCDFVRKEGYVPGIWTAPLMHNLATPFYRKHPDWFATKADGNVYTTHLGYGVMAILDVTQPRVQEHLRKIYKRMVDCGFDYFKVDFTQLALGPDCFADPTFGRAEIIRKTFEIIRECIGEDRYLLACGAPFESVIGIVDANRSTGDIHTYWGQIRQNLHGFMARSWMQESVCNVDPDFLVVRCSGTSNDPMMNPSKGDLPPMMGRSWLCGQHMTLEETKLLALGITLCGGDIFLSDAIAELNEAGIELIRKCLSAKASPARVVNLFTPGQQETPVMVSDSAVGKIVGVFNLSDQPRRIRVKEFVDLPLENAKDFWTGQTVAMEHGGVVSLPAHSCHGLVLAQ